MKTIFLFMLIISVSQFALAQNDTLFSETYQIHNPKFVIRNSQDLKIVFPSTSVKEAVEGYGFVTFCIDTLTNKVLDVQIQKLSLYNVKNKKNIINFKYKDRQETDNLYVVYLKKYLLNISFDKLKTNIYTTNPFKITYKFTVETQDDK